MSSKTDLALWSSSQQLEFVSELGALEQTELAAALCAAVHAPPKGAGALQLGYWPRRGSVVSTTIYFPHLVHTILHQAELYAPGKGICWIVVIQREAPSTPKDVLKHVRINVQDGFVSIAVANKHGTLIVCAKAPFVTQRRFTVFAGSLRNPLAPVVLRNLQKAGFSLRHVQPKCRGEGSALTS